MSNRRSAGERRQARLRWDAMDLRQLRYFLGVVDRGSIAKAADALHVAQSALSLHISRLEKELGCTLLHRTSRGIVPTQCGLRLASRARSILTDVGTIAEDVRGVGAEPAGSVTVGIPTSIGIELTVPVAIRVTHMHPLIQLRITEGLSGHMLQWLLSGQLDLALVFGEQAVPGITKDFLGKERLHLIGAEDASIVSGDAVPCADVFQLPLILPGRPHALREEVERAAAQAGRHLNVVMEVDSLKNIKALVAERMGYTILSSRVARHGPIATRLRCCPISDPCIERSIYLARSSKAPLSAAASKVSETLSMLFLRWHGADGGKTERLPITSVRKQDPV